MQVNEQDWKLFRKRIVDWQEAYMDRLNRSYMELLSGDDAASDKFWALEERIRQDKRSIGVVIQLRRSTFHTDLLRLLGEGVIGPEDLEGFSEDLRERLARFFAETGNRESS